jgi:hypothetical protein
MLRINKLERLSSERIGNQKGRGWFVDHLSKTWTLQKCDQIHGHDCYEFGHTKISSLLNKPASAAYMSRALSLRV